MQSRLASLKMPSSWNEYINTVMLESGYVSKGAIYGIDGKKWATSLGFELSKDDIMTLVRGFTDPIKLYTDGIRIGGRTFTCTRSESGLIVGRESSAGHGCVVYRCNKCLVIAVHEDGAHPGGCHVTITKLGDYLRDQGI
ncbi:hypothetical protein ACJMK2_040697 [Sinanodonta woodiana]|uniref:Profilin n=1 Tax=Sinanodonta woodiana TaxID=1069815 RepID=A0ABD3W368_SINWO